MKRILLFLTITVFGFTACKQAVEEKGVGTTIDTLKVADTTSLASLEVYPVDSLLTVELLPLGSFHNDEVDSNAANKNWFGLFKGKDGFYLASTKIKLENVYDVIVDEDENQKTGWEVSTEHKDSCYILIESLPYLKARKVEEARLEKNEIYPNDIVRFKYLNIEYGLHAIGETKNVKGNGLVIDNYKLFLSANGTKITELLVSTTAFDDNMVKIIFAGDLDGDQKLDLIIDTSSDYNVFKPTLYLSKSADNGHLLKPVGVHISVGC